MYSKFLAEGARNFVEKHMVLEVFIFLLRGSPKLRKPKISISAFIPSTEVN
jgi:hypothetical protein